MRTLRLALVAICCVLGPASIRPTDAQTADWFNLSVCNGSTIKDVSIAITSKSDKSGQSFRVAGWWNVPDSGCVNVGGFWRDKIYVFASAPSGDHWGGQATTQCINPTKRFERTVTGNYECSEGEVSVGFFEVAVPANLGLLVMTLNQ
jgi:uncharacterized membrane protein